jgi:hypothetical protein
VISLRPSTTNKHKNDMCHSSDAFYTVWICETGKTTCRPPSSKPRSRTHNDFMNKSYIKSKNKVPCTAFCFTGNLVERPQKMYIKVRLYITHRDNHLRVDKAVSDNNRFFWGGGGRRGGFGTATEKWNEAVLTMQQPPTVFKYRLQSRRFNSCEDA